MQEVITFVTENWGTISTAIGLVVIAASAVAKAIPGDTGDATLDKLASIVERIGWSRPARPRNERIGQAARFSDSPVTGVQKARVGPESGGNETCAPRN